jgi:hypothetical protein
MGGLGGRGLREDGGKRLREEERTEKEKARRGAGPDRWILVCRCGNDEAPDHPAGVWGSGRRAREVMPEAIRALVVESGWAPKKGLAFIGRACSHGWLGIASIRRRTRIPVRLAADPWHSSQFHRKCAGNAPAGLDYGRRAGGIGMLMTIAHGSIPMTSYS